VGARERANAKATDWATRFAARLTTDDAIRISSTMLASVDEISQQRWDAAKARAAATPGALRPERIDAVAASFKRELGLTGAAAGAAAAAPMVGTAATLASVMAELAWFTARAGDLILTIAAIHGRPDPTVEERRAWVLAVLLYGSSARDEFARTLNEASVGVVPTVGRQIPVTTLQTANRVMSRVFVRRYGTKRGIIALGRLLPIGLGAAIGGSANYLTIRTLARHADQFFARLPYSAIEVDSQDITGRQLD
jgi:hypothetical protein